MGRVERITNSAIIFSTLDEYLLDRYEIAKDRT